MNIHDPRLSEATRDASSPAKAEPNTSSPHRGLSVAQQLAVVLALAILAVGALLFGLPGADRRPSETEPAQEQAGFRPTPQQWAGFAFAPVKAVTFRGVDETEGKIANDDDLTTPVFSPFTGRVTRLFATAGDTVRRGDPLLSVQAAEFVQARNDLVAAVAALRTARAQLTLAQASERRQHALYQAQGGALKDWQQSQVDLASAEGSRRSAEVTLGAVRNRLRILGRADPEIAAMEAAPEALQFDPDALVTAPIGGVVVQRQVGLGQNIVSQSSGGATPVFSIGDTTRLWLVANVREVDAPRIRLDAPVEVRVLAYPDRVFKARIIYVAPSLDPVTHRLPVRAEVENPDGALKPEMFATFTIATGQDRISPAVPAEAVVYEGEEARVFVAYPADKTVTIRQIRTGRTQEGEVEVLEGLKEGDQVITRGALFIDRAQREG